MYKHTVLFCIQGQEGETNIMYCVQCITNELNIKGIVYGNDLFLN